MIPADFLLEQYCHGIFPMGMPDGTIKWFSPDPRAIIPLDKFHIPHGLKRTLKKGGFTVTLDHRFNDVIRGCANRPETWINEEIIESYGELHRLGHAHSVEVWHEGELSGGLYGVAVGTAFFGESMFSLRTDASKIALYMLIQLLNEKKFTLLDVQWLTPHLEMFGAIELSRLEYLDLLNIALI